MAKLHVSGIGSYGVAPYYQAGIAIDGTTSASASGLYAAGGWRGVYGQNLGTSGGFDAIGVEGYLEGSTYTVNGYGLKGTNIGTGGPRNYGVYGTSTGAGANSYNMGLYGTAGNGVANFGVYGISSNIGPGVIGISAGTGYNFSPVLLPITSGTVGKVSSASGFPTAVFGYANSIGSNSQCAASFLADSCTSNYGVIGRGYSALNSGTNYGVYGTTDGTVGSNYAGYFSGLLYASSAASSVKAFMIDHPLDPANKLLLHSSVESSDMMNLYNGNITTDANGEAVVTLPDYFMALNQDFKYQLTCIGTFAQAIVSEEIQNGVFKIKTDKPNVKVSWQVAGVRHDAAANYYRIKNEVDKVGVEKGFYLVPEAYGLPREMNAAYRNSGVNLKKEAETPQH